MFVLRSARSGRNNVQHHSISQFELTPSGRCDSASVSEVVTAVLTRQIRKPQIAFGIQSYAGVVDRFYVARSWFSEPIDGRLRPTVGRLAREFERSAFVRFNYNLVHVLERVQFGFSHKHRIRRGYPPFVFGETLVLSTIFVSGG